MELCGVKCDWGIVIFSSLSSANVNGAPWDQQKTLPACLLFWFKPEEGKKNWSSGFLPTRNWHSGCCPGVKTAPALSCCKDASCKFPFSVSSCLCVWGIFEVWVLLVKFFKVSTPQSVMGKTVTWEGGNPCLLSFSKDYKWHYFHGHVSDRKHRHDGVFNNAYFLGAFGCLHGILGLNALFYPESCFWMHQKQIFLCHGNVTVKCWMLVRI